MASPAALRIWDGVASLANSAASVVIYAAYTFEVSEQELLIVRQSGFLSHSYYEQPLQALALHLDVPQHLLCITRQHV